MRFKLWSKDRKPGAKTGAGSNNAWRVVKQAAARPMGC
jgi:predicted lipoprotein with Yx(FWY)xxD motif